MSERTKAVVRAAERLAMAMDLRMERDALDGEFLAHNAIEVDDLRKEAREAAAELVRALAIPLSGLELVGEKTIDCSGYDLAWTSTPPTADGHYWIRGFGAYGVARVLGGYAMFPGLTRRYDLDALSVEHEFWPVRLQEPPA